MMRAMDSLRKIVKPGGGSIAQQVMLLLLAALVIANVVSIFIIAAQPPPQRQVADFSQAIARLKTVLPQVEGASGGGDLAYVVGRLRGDHGNGLEGDAVDPARRVGGWGLRGGRRLGRRWSQGGGWRRRQWGGCG